MNKSDAKLQKLMLGPDWIDLSFGEPVVVANALFKQLNRFGDPFKMPTIHSLKDWTYQPAAGKPDLVQVLEEKYGSKVVVCNGGKQALAAALYAFRKSGINDIYFESPFYPSSPTLIDVAGLIRSVGPQEAESLLITSPNNPDGNNRSNIDLISLSCSKPMIHDAAYYTEIYLPKDQPPLPIGGVQTYSVSKMYGLSGLRIGYAVCHNEKYYRDMVDFMEQTTAGVSTASQDIVRNIEMMFKDHPEYHRSFIDEARANLIASREELNLIDPSVLELMPCQTNSMFAWFKAGPALNATAAKVYMLPGDLFGTPGMIRMNIAHPPEVISEAVSRLNKHKI